jgi:DNA polymerase-3 subunit delta
MKPKMFLQELKKGRPGPGYLFLGNELFFRDRCRQALGQAVVGAATPEAAGEGWIELDLNERPLEALLDEARTLSLFASERLIVGLNAEAALPKRLSARGETAEAAALAAYLKKPTPGVTILLECRRYDWSDREDKGKLERVAKFYSSVPQTVEFAPLSAEESLGLAQRLAQRLELDISDSLLGE